IRFGAGVGSQGPGEGTSRAAQRSRVRSSAGHHRGGRSARPRVERRCGDDEDSAHTAERSARQGSGGRRGGDQENREKTRAQKRAGTQEGTRPQERSVNSSERQCVPAFPADSVLTIFSQERTGPSLP